MGSSEIKFESPPQPPKENEDNEEINNDYEEDIEDGEFPEEEDEEDVNETESSETKKESNIEYDSETLEAIKEADVKRNAHEQVLKGNCYELKTNEYKYQLCPFDKTTQSPLNGGSTTSLGKWGSWQGNNHSEMKFEKGLGCWNGPARSTKVVLECGSEHKLVLVDEPSRCSYLFKFTTPCACRINNHDEL